MNCSQFFPKRSARKDRLDIYLAFYVHLWEGDIDDLEQRCPAMDHFCHSLSSFWLFMSTFGRKTLMI